MEQYNLFIRQIILKKSLDKRKHLLDFCMNTNGQDVLFKDLCKIGDVQ
jgi:hypothetical protein